MLLVEDSELVTDALRLLLEASGHRVRVAATVAAALDALAAERPDVVFLDLSLPDGSGIDVARHVSAGAEPRPVIHAMTGHDDPAIEARCREAGCRTVLIKPVSSKQLLAVLRDE